MIFDNQRVLVKGVNVESQEWKDLAMQFKLTQPTAKIIKIERIQNKKLWKIFHNEVKDLKEKYAGEDPLIKILHHGTGNNKPEIIYQSEEGFNINYSNEGMWGRAIYFAVNSSYSHNYSFNAGPFRQMFMASVLIGKTQESLPKSSFREPGYNPVTKLQYDSVSGNTNGSDVFMVYSNKKAYPSYLISYTV